MIDADTNNAAELAPTTIGAEPSSNVELDDLLLQFETHTRRDSRDAPPSAPVEDGVGQGNSGDSNALDDLVNPDSPYWKLREQSAYVNRQFEELNNARLEMDRRKDEADTDALIKEVRGSFGHDQFTDKDVRNFIFGEVRENPAYLTAYNERESNPRVYAAAQRQLGRDFAKWASAQPDPEVTEDRNAVVAAVRGASLQRAPERQATNYGRQTHGEFRRSIQEEFGFDPGV